MDCPTEEALIRSTLANLPDVAGMEFNLLQRRLTVRHTGAREVIVHALEAIDLPPSLETSAGGEAPAVEGGSYWRLALGLAAAIGAEAYGWLAGTDFAMPTIVLSLLAIGVAGLQTYRKGLIAIRHLNLNINALMSIAVSGAVLTGHWGEAAMVMVLFSIAELIEAKSLEHARKEIHGLLALAPDTATVREADGSWRVQEAGAIAVGALVRVGPGERIALDGVLTAGESAVNQAPITGESMPVAKAVGDVVYAGTVNETGSFEFRVTAPQSASRLSRIIDAMEQAQESKAPTQRFVDRFSRIFTPVVLAIALAVALLPPLLMAAPWTPWIYKALVLLVIACPCAFVISTPVTIVSGLAAAARSGILIKGGVYLEQGHKLRTIAFDKTGTITHGRPQVTGLHVLRGDASEALRLAASLAARSEHPVSRAVLRHWASQGGGAALAEVTEFSAITGRGCRGRIGGKWHYLGNHRLVEELGVCSAATEQVLLPLEQAGQTAIAICNEEAPLAVIGVADTVRPTSREAIAQLQALNVRTLMLSGDNAATVAAIAREVGIDDARGNLLPEEKLAVISEELQRAGMVGMVGDGINDGPALARASIGFAMGAAGTDTARETAAIAIMDDDLRKVALFIRTSRRTNRILRQNIATALGIKAAFLALAIAGAATLWMAVFADMGASLLVVFNGLRLLRQPPVPR